MVISLAPARISNTSEWQAEHVKALLVDLGHTAEIRVITTTGDKLLDRRLEQGVSDVG